MKARRRSRLWTLLRASPRREAWTNVAPEERIATFDNDGTLWSEQPYYFQVTFALESGESTGVAASGMAGKRAV
jgi:hypothetical protein